MNPDEFDFFRHLKKEQNQLVALNLIKSLDDRSLGHFKHNVKSKEERELYAEEELIRKEKYEELRCEMPGMPRSTFLMVFSPDGTKVASTHGNHNIYVTDLRSGKNVKTLVGHPRTPWCIAFHPTSNQIVASGCLGGQVRIWDLSGGSEVWTATNQSVIASIAFHPNDRILVIATINEVYFWDWSKPEPFCHTATGNQKEKVRYVAFDKLGHKLITGISNSQNRWEYVRSSVPVSRQSERPVSPYRRRLPIRIYNFPSRQTTQQPPVNTTPREPVSSVPERERNITMCYRNLVREYGRLVQRYLQLYRPPEMIDRGTDPMEQNNSSNSNLPQTQTSNSEPVTNNTPNISISTDSSSQTGDPQNSSPNPYQLLTPSRILAVMNRPTTLIRSTQTTESRKHKVEGGIELADNNGGKKIKINEASASENLSVANETDNTCNASCSKSGSPVTTTSTDPGPSKSNSTYTSLSSFNTAVSSAPSSILSYSESPAPRIPSLIPNQTTSDSSNTNLSAVPSHILNKTVDPCTSTASRETPKNALLDLLNKLPKVSKATQKSLKHRSEGSSTSEKSDDEHNIGENSSSKDETPINPIIASGSSMNTDSKIKSEETKIRVESSNSTGSNPEISQSSSGREGAADYSRPGTSREDTEAPREAQRLELMMMNIRRNAEEKLRSRFLPLIRSVPENDRLELIRLFEQGVKESREKARLTYRNMGQMFNKKSNRRPILDTSSDTTSSEDERDLLSEDVFHQPSNRERVRTEENSNQAAANPNAHRSPSLQSTSNDAYHDINNLENWVTSLFDDIESHNTTTTDATRNLDNTQPATTNSTSTIDSLLDRPPRSNRVQSIRRIFGIFARVLRDQATSLDSVNSPPPPQTTSAPSTPVLPARSSVSPSASTNTRSTNSSNYSFARRRLSSHRSSAFLPTRVYYPRTPPEFRRSRQFSFGRWRLNQRPYHSHNIGDRPIPSAIVNNSSNFASDEVINFSELPNSEDDPIPTFDRRPSTSSSYPLQFHPFNPPPDLPTINPENIGIGNMYSNIVQDLESSLNDVRNIRAANRPGEMSDMLSNFSERLENIMNQSEIILRNLRSSVEMLPGNEPSEVGQESSTPTVSYSDSSFFVRDQRSENVDLERNIDSMLDENPPNNVTSDHTYPRNSDSSTSPSLSGSSGDTMSPLMTSLHLTISHIQRQARLLRQQIESIERIDRAMVEVAQLQLMRLLLVELSRYVRNMSGESRSTCMSSVRQMMAGTRISDSSPSESQTNDNSDPQPHTSQSQPSTSNASSDSSNMPSARTRGLAHKTYPPSRLSRLQRLRRVTFSNHMPRRYALRFPPRYAPNLLSPSVSVNIDQSMLNMYSRINTFTLNRMSRRLDELINEQVRIFTQRSRSFLNVPPRMPGGSTGEQNLAMRLRDSIARTNRLVGSIFDANVVRNYRIDSTTVYRDGNERFYARLTISYIIDGISSHLDETRGYPLPHHMRLQLQGVMTMSMLLSELLLLHIVDSIPPPTDMNLDQERQSLTNRIDQICTTMMLSSRLGGYSIHLAHSLRKLQMMIRQNSNQPSTSMSDRRRTLSSHSRSQDTRSRTLYRSQRMNTLNRIRNARLWPRNDDDEEREERRRSSRTRTPVVAPTSSSPSIDRRVDADSLLRESRQESEIRIAERSREPLLSRDSDPFIASGGNTQHSTANRFTWPSNASQQNSESDDNSRQSENDIRREPQVSRARPDLGNWPENSWSSTSADPRNTEVRYGDTNATNESNPSTSQPFRITPIFRSNHSVNATAPSSSGNTEEWSGSTRWSWNVIPSVQVNDVPVSEFGPSQESSESDNPPNLGNNINNNNNNNTYPTRGVMARLAAIRAVHSPLGVFRPRFLHPLYASVNPFDADLDDPQREHIYDSDVITTVTPNHRIQVWDISDSVVPVISNPLKNVVVGECKIHNDASVDIASDGSILVTLLPSGGYLNITNRLGVYSLKWETLGQCLYTTNFDHNAVSVSLSPLGRHLVVGLASRRVSIVPSERWIMATIFRIEQKDMPGDRLPVVKKLDQSRDGRATSHKSVNCIRWLPSSGQGLIYATNTGQLVIWT